jgi:WD40 repeat protein
MTVSVHLYCDHCGAANPPHAHFCFACGSTLQDSHQSAAQSTTLPIGHLLKGRYRIARSVGTGGYGKVYKATDCQFGDRPVAVKEMIQQGLSTQEVAKSAQAFRHEAFLLAALTHPNLPSIYDYFSEDDRYYLVMSFIEGETLLKYSQRHHDQRLPPEKVMQIAVQLASVLSYLHSRKPPIVFRDLKPVNIMRTPEGQIYLIDFGIARHFKPDQAKDTFVLGSPGYAAPEQYGKSQTTPQSDMYSLGATLHQLLTGDDPSSTPFRYRSLHLSDYPQLGSLIMCMLERDMKKRPVSMGNVKRELQRMLVYGARSTHPSLNSVYACAVVPGPAHLGKMLAIAEHVAISCPLAITGLTWSPDGQRIAYASGQSHIQALDAVTRQSTKIQCGTGARVTGLSWSPDSRSIACACSDGLVHVLDSNTEKSLHPYPAHTHAIEAVAWSPNGKYIASASDCAVHIWHARSHNTSRIYREHRGTVLSVHVMDTCVCGTLFLPVPFLIVRSMLLTVSPGRPTVVLWPLVDGTLFISGMSATVVYWPSIANKHNLFLCCPGRPTASFWLQVPPTALFISGNHIKVSACRRITNTRSMYPPLPGLHRANLLSRVISMDNLNFGRYTNFVLSTIPLVVQTRLNIYC